MIWELTYRGGDGTGGVQRVGIETLTDSEDEAKELGAAVVNGLNSPSATYMAVRPAVVARTTDFPELASRYGAAKSPDKRSVRIGA